MKSLFPISTLCCILVTLFSGCQNIQPQSTVPPATPAPQTAESARDVLSAWLADATPPAVVQCSVDRSTAPEAVDRFNALSERIAGLYAEVYQDAQAAAAAAESGDVALDSVLAKAAEQLTDKSTEATDWKTTAQAKVIANYQAAMQEIDAHGKQLTEYTDSLRTDGSISNLTSRLEQTKVLVQLGKDTAALGRQLKETSDGLSAIRARRITTALGK